MDYKISVIVPVYKVRDRIIRTLESLKEQTFKEFEVLFIDDGSPDDSSEFADAYLKDSDVNYRIIKKKNGGVSSARNLGIKEAKGEYVQFLDSDDYIDKNMLLDFYTKIKEKDFDVIYSSYVFENNDGTPITDNKNDLKEGIYSGIESSIGLAYGISYTHIMANMFKRSLLIENNIEFDENRKFAEDISFMIKTYAHSKKIYCLNNIYAHYVKWEQSAMNTVSINYLDVYYSNIETLQYIRDKIKNLELEKAMIQNRIPAGIVNIFAAFCVKDELREKLYEFINKKEVRNALGKYKMVRFEKDRLKYLVLSKIILMSPNVVEKYYLKK